MRKLYVLLFLAFQAFMSNGQSRILKLDPQNESFKNSPIIPSFEPFIIEGEVENDIVWVEVKINKSKSKDYSSYSWNRSYVNQSSNFDVIITQGLLGSSKYDFSIRTFKTITPAIKQQLLTSLIKKIYLYLDAQIAVKKNAIELDHPSKQYDILNEIVLDGIQLLRSRNGLEIKRLSELIKHALKDVNDYKVIRFVRKNSEEGKLDLTQTKREKKVRYLTTLILDELQPFFNSDLVQQHRSFDILEASTEKNRFTLPINAGLYSYTSTPNLKNIKASNSGVVPGIGFTIPVFRNYSVKGKKLPSLGLSFGILVQPIKSPSGVKLSTPGINLPIYGALGINFLKVIRLNLGVLVVAPHKVSNPNSLTWVPTVGLAFELEGWIGLKR